MHPFRSRPALVRLVAAACVGLVGITTACTATQPGTATPAVTQEQRGPAGSVPPGLERFYGQALSWGACEPYGTTNDAKATFAKGDRDKKFDCARLTVPLDYANPDGRTATIGLLRAKATDPAQRIGSLIVNPGGPGGSGMQAAAGWTDQVRKNDLGKRFDLVGFDPRGIGASQPAVNCLTDAERDADRQDNDVDTSPEGVAQTEQENKDYAAKCAERTGTDVLANVGTRDVARDMDVLRSALGDEKLTYAGFSYGTRIGTAYAEAFPNNVRALVLDGAVDPLQNPVDELVAQGAGFQKAFEDFSAWCAKQEECALGHDPAGATKAFQDLTRPLIDNPVRVGNRQLSYSDASTAAIQAMYAQELWQYLNTGLGELREGTGNTLLLLADSYYGRGLDGHYSSIMDAFNAVRCVDDPRLTDRNVLLEAARRYQQAAPFLDDGQQPAAVLDACAFWPVPNTSQPHQPSVQGLPPVLVVSTTGDPATPYQAGVDLAKALNGGMLTYEGTQHTAFLMGNKCVDDAGTKYLIDLQLPAEGTRCTAS
ncbi:alpha/beta hydrolase [Goodfellowiella coeruleoviolacea]|uniref:Tripeptidyl-peptidase B, Serine peptidase, MEROPS family S33 n=1 Tax=Goodfellowiella coeruleoviolacea TaxID=334858 RepID=A0AAE3GN88_9PSEU|nr:alpha/beta hydrolase [Goodfellowiella coeruleoviolacea]MCP2170364.1 tripeptidyl-peptidase B, Serine peptidase, MEROPS family S33 [Goodfellowiella coeruleoviolacea]